MFNSPILEVAIGMIFYYLLLSMICSALNEMIEAWLKNRAVDLENGIRRLVDDQTQLRSFSGNLGDKLKKLVPRRSASAAPTTPQGLAARLYDHALIRCLYISSHELPSYIPARNFAIALMDLMAPGQSGAAGATLPSSPAATPSATIVNVGTPLTQPPAPPAPPPPPRLTALRAAIADPANVPSTKLRDALLALMDAAGDDPARVRENIENWYNTTMDRVSGWYKRRTQIIILCLGVGIAIVLNADSVIVGNALWRNSTLRANVAAAAQSFSTTDKSNTSDQFNQAKRQLGDLQLPIAWTGNDDAHRLPVLKEGVSKALAWSLYQLDLHWLGWIITGLAISLGAPFWFDILNKFIVVRSTVKPQEKSPEEPSKD